MSIVFHLISGCISRSAMSNVNVAKTPERSRLGSGERRTVPKRQFESSRPVSTDSRALFFSRELAVFEVTRLAHKSVSPHRRI